MLVVDTVGILSCIQWERLSGCGDSPQIRA